MEGGCGKSPGEDMIDGVSKRGQAIPLVFSGKEGAAGRKLRGEIVSRGIGGGHTIGGARGLHSSRNGVMVSSADKRARDNLDVSSDNTTMVRGMRW